MIHPQLANEMMDSEIVRERLFETKEATPEEIADFKDLWHVACCFKWSAQSIPGMMGNVIFTWLDVPEEALCFLQNNKTREFISLN